MRICRSDWMTKTSMHDACTYKYNLFLIAGHGRTCNMLWSKSCCSNLSPMEHTNAGRVRTSSSARLCFLACIMHAVCMWLDWSITPLGRYRGSRFNFMHARASVHVCMGRPIYRLTDQHFLLVTCAFEELNDLILFITETKTSREKQTRHHGKSKQKNLAFKT